MSDSGAASAEGAVYARSKRRSGLVITCSATAQAA
jgi:hypothetical protein